MKKYIVFVFLFLSSIFVCAQNISVKSFRSLSMDMTASSLEGKRVDQNGDVAALIKVMTTEKGFLFEGGVLGIVDVQQRVGELWVWVPHGLRKITILHQQLGELRDYVFPETIDAERTYEMVLTTAKIETIVKEEVHEQYLTFRVVPTNAVLEVEDKIWELNSQGSATKYVSFGTYSYRVQARNYHADAGKVRVDDPENSKTITVNLRPNFGWIEVAGTGNLQGASVYIDNELVGKAPCKSEALKSGQHTVKIARKAFESYTATVTVNDGETTFISTDLKSKGFEITLKVDADAEIWVNDEFKGFRVWTGPMVSGTYKLECKQVGCETAMTIKDITEAMAGQTLMLSSPVPVYGSLEVKSDPNGVLYIDGENKGTTPKSFDKVLTGPHEIRLTRDGYEDHIETVTIIKGERMKMQVVMKKEVRYVAGLFVPEGAVAGLFSVSPRKQVFFSQGNLQYQASKKIWRFAEHQYDCVGKENKNVSSRYKGWIDLFAWGTSGYDWQQPYRTKTYAPDTYGDGTNPIANTNYDWGVYNAISNGGNRAGLWRTLTMDEWDYLINKRSPNSGILYAKACVCGMNGIILLPDDWNASVYGLNKTNRGDVDYDSNIISAVDWKTMERAGAVFLPAAGCRFNYIGTENKVVGSQGYYWSTTNKSFDQAYYLKFTENSAPIIDGDSRDNGLSVRLVCPAQ